MSLKTDYKDFELAPEMGGKRRYKMINNDDGTVSFVDVSEYLEIGDAFKAEDINATNNAINEISKDIKRSTWGYVTLSGNQVTLPENALYIIGSRIKPNSYMYFSLNNTNLGTMQSGGAPEDMQTLTFFGNKNDVLKWETNVASSVVEQIMFQKLVLA